MKTSFWRYLHLVLALVIFAFLLTASLTGGILAFSEATEQIQTPHQVKNESLAEIIEKIQTHISEISEIEVENRQVTVKGLDDNMSEVGGVISPKDGRIAGKAPPKPEWLKNIKALHRSLFLHETGRLIVGGTAALFLISLLTGFVLLYRRQGDKILHNAEMMYKSDFIHFLGGKWFAIPLTIIALTGSVMFVFRLGLIDTRQPKAISFQPEKNLKHIQVKDFPIFKSTPIAKVKKLIFPLFEEEEDFFELTTTTETLKINQFTGQVLSKQPVAEAKVWKRFNQELHTGESNTVWAFVLFLSAMVIPLLIGSGVFLWLNRRPKKLKNQYMADEAEYILLIGSQSGSTSLFAHKIHRQLLNAKHPVYISYLNDYQLFPKAKKLIVFTCTYGEGEAPDSADQFETLLTQTPQNQNIDYTVVGFGSESYPDFCGFAKRVNALLSEQSWANELLPLHTVNEHSTEELAFWTEAWNEKTGQSLMTNPMYYHFEVEHFENLSIVAKTPLDEENQIFNLTLKPLSKKSFQSGDILGIYPEGNHRERLYSIGKVGRNIQLFVKLHPHGLGSQYLYRLNAGEKIKARIINNEYFHFPQKASRVLMIGNGTGIAPFLGMINTPTPGIEKTLYAGFRHRNKETEDLRNAIVESRKKHLVEDFRIAYSTGDAPKRVTDLLRENPDAVVDTLKQNGVIMLCGSLAMQKSVEALIEELCQKNQLPGVAALKENHRIRTDCY